MPQGKQRFANQLYRTDFRDFGDETGEPQDQGEIADIEEIALETAEIAITDL